MTVLAVIAAVVLLLLVSVIAGLIGFAVLGALRMLEGGLTPAPARVVDAPARRVDRTTATLVDPTCQRGPTRL